MRKNKKLKAIAAVVTSTAVTLLAGMTSYASVLIPSQYGYYVDANYGVGEDLTSAVQKADEALDTEFKASGLAGKGSLYTISVDGRPQIYVPAEYVNAIKNEEEAARQWLDKNMRAIVPDGTDPLKVPKICAVWLADNMHHDWSIEKQGRTNSFQSAIPGFYNAYGVCAT